MNTKHLSFLFNIPDEFFSPKADIPRPREVNVCYTLYWNKKVEVDAYYLTPGMAKLIVNWQGLEDEMQKAAENNSKQYRAPGDWMSNQVPQDVDAHFVQAMK
jgi:hypothetical protein